MFDSSLHPPLTFRKATLANGLDVILHPRKCLPQVSVNLWYHVGSKNEERTQRGFTHLFEHLMFEGSRHYPGDFFKHLQKLGASINGSTSSDRTNYYVDLPTAHVELAVAMESDRMSGLMAAVDESKLRIQKGVVKNEYRQNYENRPYGMAWLILAETLYPPSHPYSWLPIGVMEDLDGATMADVSAFFRRYYGPSNASLVLAGDLEEARGLELAERYFGGIAGGIATDRPWVPAVELAQPVSRTLHDQVELERLYLVWPTVPHHTPDDAPLMILADVLGRGRASRLYRRLVLDEQVAQDVTVFQGGRELAGSFAIICTLRPGRSLDDARRLVDHELNRLAQGDTIQDELERVKRGRRSSFVFSLEHVGGFGGVADRLNQANVFQGDPRMLWDGQERFEQVTLAEITTAAAKYLWERPRVELDVVGRGRTVFPPLDRTIPPAVGPMAGYRPDPPLEIGLACGASARFFRRTGRGTIAGSIVIPGGATLQGADQPGLAHAAADMLDEGTQTRSASRLALEIESLGASLSAAHGWDGLYVSFRCLSADLPECLDLVVDVLRNPSFPEAEWDRARARFLAALKAERDSPDARANRAFLALLYPPGHPYRTPIIGTAAALQRYAGADLAAFHERTARPVGAACVLAGDLDPDQLAGELDRRLSGWTGASPARPAILAPERPRGKRIVVLDRPGAAQAVVRLGCVGISRDDPDFDRMVILNQILGGQFTSRLNATLREERGLTYGVRSGFDCRRGAGPFAISAAVQADQVALALELMHREIVDLLDNRPPEEREIDDARRALVDGRTREYETPAGLVARFSNLWVHGLPFEHERRLADRLGAVTRHAIIDAASRLLLPDSFRAVVVADAAASRTDLENLGWGPIEVVADHETDTARIAL